MTNHLGYLIYGFEFGCAACSATMTFPLPSFVKLSICTLVINSGLSMIEPLNPRPFVFLDPQNSLDVLDSAVKFVFPGIDLGEIFILLITYALGHGSVTVLGHPSLALVFDLPPHFPNCRDIVVDPGLSVVLAPTPVVLLFLANL